MSHRNNSLLVSATVLAALAPISFAARVRMCYLVPTGNNTYSQTCHTYDNMDCNTARAGLAPGYLYQSCGDAPKPALVVLPDAVAIGRVGGLELQADASHQLAAVRIAGGTPAWAPLPAPVLADPSAAIFYTVLAPGETLTGLPFSGSEPFNPPIVGGGGGGGAGSFTVCAVNFDINTRTILSISTAAIDEADLVFSPLTGPCPADVGSQGGLTGADGSLDNNDFVVFIDAFFNSNPLADMGVQGGARGSDGLFDNNDFVAFIDQFFTPC